MQKPHLKLVSGQLVEVECTLAMKKAREKFGKPFAIESGSTWKPKAVPILTAWLQTRGK